MDTDLDTARYIRGVALLEAGEYEQAEACFRQVSEASPDFGQAQYHLGIVALRTSRLDDALRNFHAATRVNPGFGAAWNNLGDVQMRTGQWDDAETSLRRATTETPSLAEAFYNLGTLLLRTGRLTEAQSCLHRAIVLRPDFPQAYNNLCEVMVRAQRLDQAESCVRQAIALAPDFAPAHYNLGNLMVRAQRLDEAELSLREAVRIDPDFADANHNLGQLLLNQNRGSEAETFLRKETALRPESAMSWNALGTALMGAQRVPDALACFERACALDRGAAEARYNLGGALMSLNRLDEAVTALSHAYTLAPMSPSGRLMLGMTLLKLGRYREGWPHYEFFSARRAAGEPRSGLAGVLPEWQGEPLAGRSLIVLCDYGFGDAIQFIRFMPVLKAWGLARLTVVCQPELKRLFESVSEIDAVKSTEDHIDLRQAECWCYLTSVPLRLDVTLESVTSRHPYLKVPAALIKRWGRRLERELPAGRPRVGLVGAGNRRLHDWHAAHMDERRSLPHVGLFAPLLDVPDVSFVSLHKDAERQAQWRTLPAARRGPDVMDEVVDFADTGALMRNLDLVVTIDTSVAHLAGALNVPFWLLLNDDCDWRWLHERTDSPWYPGAARLFRQRVAGAWDDVIGDATVALRRWAVCGRVQ